MNEAREETLERMPRTYCEIVGKSWSQECLELNEYFVDYDKQMEEILNDKEYKKLDKEVKSEEKMAELKKALFKTIADNNQDSADRQAKIEQRYQDPMKKVELLNKEVERASAMNKMLWNAY